ncbi:MAG: KpsF/GutQ family sugar-phosphate isomerase [Deltaproteobacteria bacterium]|jgi:arabinose-5-phosphate isomerase|nr:MAG: KpsF/GutQ family sugar-phosphate isomerase [Deltaproteobacteria bacterium]
MPGTVDTLKKVLNHEADVLRAAADRLQQDQADKLCQLFQHLMDKGGSLVFSGVGKSGIVATKLASTFSSLGLPSFFLHPIEALHGDLGRLSKNDVLVLLSKSGATEELMKMIPYVPVGSEFRVGLLGNANSKIGEQCSLVLDCSVDREACINNQAPTTSSTLAMAMGDAMAVLFEEFVGLSKEGFAANHPGGLLGKSLRLKVSDLMWKIDDCPILSEGETLKTVILEMTNKPVGGCAICNNNNQLLGILVEGDIRRTFTKANQGLETKVEDIMNKTPITVGPDDLAYDALILMEKRDKPVHLLPVVENGIFKGFLRLHDLLKEGFSIQS